MQVSIYSNGSQECERASSLLKAVHLDEVVVYEKGKHFTEGQFRDEFGDEVEYPMISIGMFRGTLKETMNYMVKRNVCVKLTSIIHKLCVFLVYINNRIYEIYLI